MKSTKADKLKVAVKNIKILYKLRGFNITKMYMNGEFEYLCGLLAEMDIRLNV